MIAFFRGLLSFEAQIFKIRAGHAGLRPHQVASGAVQPFPRIVGRERSGGLIDHLALLQRGLDDERMAVPVSLHVTRRDDDGVNRGADAPQVPVDVAYEVQPTQPPNTDGVGRNSPTG